MEWTTQSEQQAHIANGGEPQSTQPLPAQSVPSTPAVASPPPVPTTPPAPHPHGAPVNQPTTGYDHCPSCGALVMTDQRYCLACGHRRGDPRLPFMDAVVFMDAMKQPKGAQSPPPKRKERKISPNAALIAGVGTLLLALGIGVLIGRSGESTSSAPQQAPIVIKGGGTGDEANTASAAGATIGGGVSGAAGRSKKVVKKEKQAAAESGEGAEDVLKPNADVNLPPPTTGVGDKCKKGSAGCNESGQFDGSFFGE